MFVEKVDWYQAEFKKLTLLPYSRNATNLLRTSYLLNPSLVRYLNLTRFSHSPIRQFNLFLSFMYFLLFLFGRRVQLFKNISS